ncbi:hypothetical protein L2X99_05530 [Microbacterium sp. KUDC0406]|uniref:TA system VapC family ribonuclease toxin n=1 Tax=Microbacterium sp. KUDC0406 TaxID=2909588 RepID=UPI001F48D440|nr:TA system VapC family ribonuclease toxin [Microbacterium sp. KUDC0406]UJP11663.1 hypothetical protein L2X99_05530 [Microbacterium sp. KUDC0406]
MNVLLALTWTDHVHHDLAHERFASTESWSTTSITEIGLLRLMMTESVIGRPVPAVQALEQVRALRRAEGWSWISGDVSPTTWVVAGGVLRGHRQVTDLHLVNVAAANNAVLATFDSGIQRSLRPQERSFVELWS